MIFRADSKEYLNHLGQYLVVFNSKGERLQRVWGFDTESLVCNIGGGNGRMTIAAGFCFAAATRAEYERLCYFLPAGLRSFVVRMDYEADAHKLLAAEVVGTAVAVWISSYLAMLPSVPEKFPELRSAEEEVESSTVAE